MSEENPRRLYVYAIIEEETHTELLRAASKKGIHISDLVRQYVVNSLAAEEDESDPEFVFYKKVANNRNHERIFNQMRSQVFSALQKKDNDELDQLEKHCEKLGISYEEVLDSVQDSDTKPIVYDNPTSSKAAMSWLLSVMDEKGEYRATGIMEQAKMKGFTVDTLNRAKRALGINSHHTGGAWYWSR
jgi:hypothetical protein